MRIKWVKHLTVVPRSELVLSNHFCPYHNMKPSAPSALLAPLQEEPGGQEISSHGGVTTSPEESVDPTAAVAPCHLPASHVETPLTNKSFCEKINQLVFRKR